ncbi:MAG: hypothetical protein ABSD38_34005 [Syntrophorhabdales bacterium]
MNKLIAVSLSMAGMVLMGGFLTLTQTQGPAIDAKPTFVSPTPGLRKLLLEQSRASQRPMLLHVTS